MIVFYETPPNTFLNTPETVLSVSITGTFSDGTAYDVSLPVTANASIEARTDGARGNWQGSGFKFEGTDDMRKYVVKGDNPAFNVSGSFVLESVGPSCMLAKSDLAIIALSSLCPLGCTGSLPLRAQPTGLDGSYLPGSWLVKRSSGLGCHR